MKQSILLMLPMIMLILATLCSSSVLSKHYHIVPADSACHANQHDTCLTLEQLAQSDLTSVGEINLILSFLPGKHVLSQSLIIHNFTNVQMKGMNGQQSVVSFHQRVRIEICHSDKLSINNLNFKQNIKGTMHTAVSLGLRIAEIQTVHLAKCQFIDIYNELSDSAVYISESTNATFKNVVFEGIHGIALNVQSCIVNILTSKFTQNHGSTVYIDSTMTEVYDTRFDSNTGRVLTIHSATAFITQCQITNNVNAHRDPKESGIIRITPSNSFLNSKCNMPNFHSVVTHNTEIYMLDSKYSSKESLCRGSKNIFRDGLDRPILKSPFHCIDFNDILASDSKNISNMANDIIYDFNTNGSHGNRGRFCVNTDYQHTLEFTNRAVFCDDETRVVRITKNITPNKQTSTKIEYTQDYMSGNVLITSCSFTNNTSNGGGSLSVEFSAYNENLRNVLITSCRFINNSNGGAVFVGPSPNTNTVIVSLGNLLVTSCTFINNTNIGGSGGAISMGFHSEKRAKIHLASIYITSSIFTNNTSSGDAGGFSLYFSNDRFTNIRQKNVLITFCTFINNTSYKQGGALSFLETHYGHSSTTVNVDNILITSCNFTGNTGHSGGGAISIDPEPYTSVHLGTIFIASCSFTQNKSPHGAGGGAISAQFYSDHHSLNSIVITSCIFIKNACYSCGGGAIYFANRYLVLQESVKYKINILSISYTDFISNHAYRTRALVFHMNVLNSKILTVPDSTVSLRNCYYSRNGILLSGIGNATIEQSVFAYDRGTAIFIHHSTVIFNRKNTINNNKGPTASVISIFSNLKFIGSTTISNNHHSAVHAILSHVFISSPEGVIVTNNTAYIGGGFFLVKSTMTVNHPLEISNNTAHYGGGIYAYLSSIEFTSKSIVSIRNNIAIENGGGIAAKALTVKILRSFVQLHSNLAKRGGGMYMDHDSQIFLFVDVVKGFNTPLTIIYNSAQFGGGIFVDDTTATKSFCKQNSKQKINYVNPPSLCFLQGLDLSKIKTKIANNTASKIGKAIYGGLLDRCIMINFFQVDGNSLTYHKGLDYINKTVVFSNYQVSRRLVSEQKKEYTRYSRLYPFVSSDPVSVKFCDNFTNSTVQIKYTDSVRVSVLALDQVGYPVNATIHSSVITASGVGHLKEGQAEQRVGNQCTELEYNVLSQDNAAQLELYARGPCTNFDSEISKKTIKIVFLCTCAIGLQPSYKNSCKCVCDPKLLNYIINCSQEFRTIEKKPNIWIGVENNSSNGTVYIIHDCPFDYCIDKPVNITSRIYKFSNLVLVTKMCMKFHLAFMFLHTGN